MHFKDLRQYIEVIDKLGELKRVDGADWNLEVGALTELMAEKNGTALLFDKIVGYPAGYRVFTNAMLSLKRTAMVLGLPEDVGGVQMLNAWRKKLGVLKLIPPVEVKDGPVLQNVHTGKEIDLLEFPAPKWHEPDGGRYLGTGSAVITRDPEEGWVNVGTYRCMVYDKNHLGVRAAKGKHSRMMIDKYHAKGQSAPIAISFGHDPALWMAATDTGVLWGTSEYDFAGAFRGAPIEVIKGEVTGLPIPAASEIVIEGEIPPPEQVEPRPEGPFGEWTGYFADTTSGSMRVIITVKRVLHRNDPIILGAPPLRPPAMSRCALPLTAAEIHDQMEKAGIPGVKGVWQLAIVDYPLVVVVAVEQMYPGHARQAGLAAISCGASMLNAKVVVVVDEDIDITDADDVFWAIGTRCDLADLTVLKELRTAYADPMLAQEKRLREEVLGPRVMIDACRPYSHLKDFAPVNVFSSGYRESTLKKWGWLFK